MNSDAAQDERYALPDGWAWTKIGTVCSRPQYGYTTKGVSIGTGPKPLRITDLTDKGVNWDTVPHCAKPPADPSKFRVRDADLLVARAGSVGKSYKVSSPPEAVFASYLIRFQVREAVNSDFVAHFLNSPQYWRQIEDRSTGTTMFNVNASKLADIELPIAPVPEQQRIVAKIEALFEQSRTARAALERISPLLKNFRQAVLAAAFRGDFTRDWRDQHPDIEPASALLERIRAERRRRWEEALHAKGKDPSKAKYEEPRPVDTSDLPELPEGSVWVSLGWVLQLVQYGTSVKASTPAATGIPILRMGNIRDGRLDLRDLKYIDPQDEDIAKYTLELGDVLINRTNSPELVGKAALFSCDGTYVFASYLIRLRPHPDAALPAFINFAINSRVGRRHVQSVKHQVAGQANINTDDIRSMPLPLPPLEEQKEIVAKIEGLFTQADAIEAAVEAARRRGEKLEQSILVRAFRGELVSQDPNDEPASALVDRVRADKSRDLDGKRRLTRRSQKASVAEASL